MYECFKRGSAQKESANLMEIPLKCFGEKSNFKKHERIVHYRIKPFQCQECAKYFSRQGYLTVHQRIIHDGIKPF